MQVNIGRVQTWDNHSNIFPTLKKRLLPPLDRGVATLLDDLASQGRLDDTLVMMLGEFGRTPKINKNKGRDHWGPCFFGLFAGAGVRGGQVIGKSDGTGAYPLTDAFCTGRRRRHRLSRFRDHRRIDCSRPRQPPCAPESR